MDGAAEDATMTTLVYKQQHALIDDRCNNSLLYDHVLIAVAPMPWLSRQVVWWPTETVIQSLRIILLFIYNSIFGNNKIEIDKCIPKAS